MPPGYFMWWLHLHVTVSAHPFSSPFQDVVKQWSTVHSHQGLWVYRFLSLPLFSPSLPAPFSPASFMQPANPLLNLREHILGTGTVKKRDKLICISYLGDSLAKSSTVSLTQRQERWSCKPDISLLRLRRKGVGGWSELTTGNNTVGSFVCCLNPCSLKFSWLVWSCTHSAIVCLPSPSLSSCMQLLFPCSSAGDQQPGRWAVLMSYHSSCITFAFMYKHILNSVIQLVQVRLKSWFQQVMWGGSS